MREPFAGDQHHAPRFLQEHPDLGLPQALLQGFAESMAPGILGCTLVSLAALLVAVGLWRRAGHGPSLAGDEA